MLTHNHLIRTMNTANFIGTFDSVDDLNAHDKDTLTNNDYAFVRVIDTAGEYENIRYDRYKFSSDTREWLFEYTLNNSSFTEEDSDADVHTAD